MVYNQSLLQIYRGLSNLAGMVAWPWFYWHLKSRGQGESFRPRLGFELPAGPPPGFPRIWLHGVSVGEIMAALPLAREAYKRAPDDLSIARLLGRFVKCSRFDDRSRSVECSRFDDRSRFVNDAGGRRVGINRDRRRIFVNNGWRTLVPLMGLGAIVIGAETFYADGYVPVAENSCTGFAEDGTRLRWMAVPTVECNA